MNTTTCSSLKHVKTEEYDMWEINFIDDNKRILYGAVPVCSGWYSLIQPRATIIFFFLEAGNSFRSQEPTTCLKILKSIPTPSSYLTKRRIFNLKWSTFVWGSQMVSKCFEFPTNTIIHFPFPHEFAKSAHRIGLCLSLLLWHITNK